ncbi:MAG: YehS family protein [Desulfitobacteriaceae bacterium]
MDNNDILIRLRYALDIRDTDMVKIFKLGGVELTEEEVRKLLIKSKETYRYNDEVDNHDKIEEKDENIKCKNSTLESFLNGFIIFKRGKQDPKPGQPEIPVLKNNENPNNILLKKLKIALSLTSDDMLDIFKETGVIVTKAELSALFRKEGHKHYKECGDKYARNFLKGLVIKNRG